MIENITLASLISSADEEILTALANKGIYKRALKDIEGDEPVYTEEGDSISISVGGEVCTVTAPLDKSKCSCPSRGICRHIISAVLLLRSEVPDDIPAPEKPAPEPPAPAAEIKPDNVPAEDETEKALRPADIAKINECAEMCLTLLGGIVKRGLVRCAESAPDDIEIAAVRCHAAKMADAERMMRSIAGRLRECISLSAAFDDGAFADLLCRTSQYLETLKGSDITEAALGTFRRDYEEYDGLLDILPIGMRNITSSEYAGTSYYFLDTARNSKQRFLCYSDMRPLFYDERERRRTPSAVVWDLSVPLKNMMRTRMTLKGAKLSGGKLSSSKDTAVISQTKANINCPEVHRLIINDFREVVFALTSNGSDETERMFFIHPAAVKKNEFDRYTQRLVMQISDDFSNRALITAKYTKYTKSFIELVESIGKKMEEHKEKYYTLLVTAQINDGMLELYPIEVYDFLTPIEKHTFTMPEGFDDIGVQAGHSAVIYELFNEIDERCSVLVRSGLGTSQEDYKPLVDKIKRFGMSALASLVSELFDEASAYRHSFNDDCTGVLLKMGRLKKYLKIGIQRTGLISALYNMKGDF